MHIIDLGWKEKKFLSKRVKRKIRSACRDNLFLSNRWLIHRYCSVTENDTFMNFIPEIWNFDLKDAMMRKGFFFCGRKRPFYYRVGLHLKFGPSIWMKLVQNANETTKYRWLLFQLICPSIFQFQIFETSRTTFNIIRITSEPRNSSSSSSP